MADDEDLRFRALSRAMRSPMSAEATTHRSDARYTRCGSPIRCARWGRRVRHGVTGDEVAIEMPANARDRLIPDVASILDTVGARYVVVSGYVAVLFGRARATEDIGVITDRPDGPRTPGGRWR